MTLANISLQLDETELICSSDLPSSLYHAECVRTYNVRLHVLMTTSLFKNIITDGRNSETILYFGWYAFCFFVTQWITDFFDGFLEKFRK